MADRGIVPLFWSVFKRPPSPGEQEAIAEDIHRYGQHEWERVVELSRLSNPNGYNFVRAMLRNKSAELEDQIGPVPGYDHIKGYDDLPKWARVDPLFLSWWKATGGKLVFGGYTEAQRRQRVADRDPL